MLSILFYLGVFILVFILQIIAVRQRNPKKRKAVVIVSFFVLLLLIGLRYEVGSDYVGHMKTYDYYSGMNFSEILRTRGDLGSKIIIGLIAPKIFGTANAIFWIYGLLTLIPLYIVHKKSDFKYLAYSMLAYNLIIMPASLNILRQGAAMSFILLSFIYVEAMVKKEKNSVFKMAICAAVAVVLHTSALLMLPYIFIYWLTKKKGSKNYGKMAIAMSVIVGISFLTIMRGILEDVGFSDYDYMLIVKKDVRITLGYILTSVAIFIPSFLSIIAARKERKRNIKDNETSQPMAMALSGTVFEVIGTAFSNLSRVSYYFSIFQIILIPAAIQNIKNKNTRIAIKTICMVTLIVVFVLRCYVQGRYGIIPYKTWLFKGIY